MTTYFICFVDVLFNRPMGKNCNPFLVPFFVWGRLHIGGSQEKRKEASPVLNLTYRYINDILSLNNHKFGDFVNRIYPIEIKDTTDKTMCASYLDIHLEIDSEGEVRTKHYDKRDDINFHIVNFPFTCSNILATPAYRVYISQLIR